MLGKPYAEMTGNQKVRFFVRLVLCIATLGFAFPNVMSDEQRAFADGVA